MTNTLKISLKANEKIYVNGAVIRADRKVSLEFLNDVQFLLEQHVLQVEDADTPLRQLYFIVQVMLMQPEDAKKAQTMFRETLTRLIACFSDRHILASLKDVDRLVNEGRFYEALKIIRQLYPHEAKIMNGAQDADGFPRPIAVGE